MINFKSTKLVINLSNVISRLSGRRAAARITVPSDLDWWFFQEFGTATHFNEGSYDLPEGITQADIPSTTSPSGYTISSKSGGLIRLPVTVNFPEEWRGVSVHHPGVSPKAYIRRILPDITKYSAAAIAKSLIESGFDIDAVQASLMNEIMPTILADIATSMSEQLRGNSDRDTPGKLGHDDPASVFQSAASIVDSSG